MIEKIKALPRTQDGVFDLTSIDNNFYLAAGKVYPVYTAYETNENKKAGYPDIMLQMRALEKKVEQEFTQANAVLYLKALVDTIAAISPEIYENYRELIEIFRKKIKTAMEEFDLSAQKQYAGFASKEDAEILHGALQTAFEKDVLLKEKYQALSDALVK
ncbi:MAG: hypothetical protein IJ282_03610 [Lachnospiraceae bacterium]|nr:hypothetical protein [Lachnospiraceae bacterium]